MKKYNIGKKSDMKRLERDIMNKANSIAAQNIMSRDYEVECKHCHSQVSVPAGFSYCPKCHNVINLILNVKWR